MNIVLAVVNFTIMYKIDKIKGKDKTVWNINFQFQKSTALVELTLEKGGTDLYVWSHTDGYHWFTFFMAQEPNCLTLEFEDNWGAQTEKVRKLFDNHGFLYRPEDKETCFINFSGYITKKKIETIAQLIDERFANRERFF